MPNSYETGTQYVRTSNPDTVNDATLFADGQPGQVLNQGTRTYQYVQVDSGSSALAANAANDLVGWKDKGNYIVTRDSRFWQGGRNEPAGVLRNAATSGYYVYVMQRGVTINVKSDGNGAAGDTAIANSGTAADVTNVTAGTASTYTPVGIIRGAASGGFISVDLDIPSAP